MLWALYAFESNTDEQARNIAEQRCIPNVAALLDDMPIELLDWLVETFLWGQSFAVRSLRQRHLCIQPKRWASQRG